MRAAPPNAPISCGASLYIGGQRLRAVDSYMEVRGVIGASQQCYMQDRRLERRSSQKWVILEDKPFLRIEERQELRLSGATHANLKERHCDCAM